MKLTSTGGDPLGVDTRTRSTPRPAADNSSNDNESPPFEGVLSDVKSDSKSAATKDAPAKKAPDASAAPSAPADTTTGANMIIDALKGLLAAGAATPTDAKTDAKPVTSDPAGSGDAVDSLLKKMAAKDDPATDAPANGAAQPTGTPTDMMSILLLSAGAQPAPPPSPTPSSPAATSAATTAEAATLVGTDPLAKAAPASAPAAAAASADDKEMSVTDISVSTHLPPAQAAQNKAFLANDAKTAAPPLASLTSGTAGAGSAHAHSDDLGVAGKSASPSTSATTLNAAGMGLDFGPVRSIANAITELAAPAAPAAATPEAPKPTIGIARTMTLQMNPADLGTVDIRLHITGQSLDVQLTVSDTQTLGIINRDRETLTSALHGQNYAVNSLVIQDGGAAASSGGNNNGNQGDTSGSNARADRQSSSGAGGDSQGGGGRQQGSGAERPAQDERRSRSDAPARLPAETRSGTLYV